MSGLSSRIRCAACGKVYLWKPEYAGKSLKCHCGVAVKVPANPTGQPGNATSTPVQGAVPSVKGSNPPGGAARRSAPAPVPGARAVQATVPSRRIVPAPDDRPSPDDALNDFEKALAEAANEAALAPAAAPAVAMPRGAAVVSAPAAAAVGTVASPLSGYAPPRRRAVVQDEGAAAARVHDLYVPIALIAAGLALAFLDARLMGIKNPVIAALYVTVISVLNLGLVFTALLAGVKLIDLGLGPIGTAMLKIVAVAILPAAIAGIIGHWTFGIASWGASVICYYILLSYLFEMDAQELMIVTAIIWGIRFFMNIFLIVVVLRLIGASIPAGHSAIAGAGRLGGGGSVESSDSSDVTPEDSAAGIAKADADAATEIQSGKAAEAREWLKPEFRNHIGFKMGKEAMSALADKLYAAGAAKVWAAGIASLGPNLICAEFLVEMPADPSARQAVLKVSDELNQSETPSKDNGARFLCVGLD